MTIKPNYKPKIAKDAVPKLTMTTFYPEEMGIEYKFGRIEALAEMYKTKKGGSILSVTISGKCTVYFSPRSLNFVGAWDAHLGEEIIFDENEFEDFLYNLSYFYEPAFIAAQHYLKDYAELKAYHKKYPKREPGMTWTMIIKVPGKPVKIEESKPWPKRS